MEENKNSQTGLILKHILLIDSSFHRESEVSFADDVENNLNINTVVEINSNLIQVMLQVTIDQKYNGASQVKIDVKMVGVFECVGDTPFKGDLESFGKINGAAIIYPYIREHISSMSVKAGVRPIVLPIVNFQNASQKDSQ